MDILLSLTSTCYINCSIHMKRHCTCTKEKLLSLSDNPVSINRDPTVNSGVPVYLINMSYDNIHVCTMFSDAFHLYLTLLFNPVVGIFIFIFI